MLANTRAQWGSVSKTLHWTIAILIVLEIPAGYLMSYTYGLAYRDKGVALPLHNLFSQIHHTNGFLILLLATVRLGWRIHGLQPAQERDSFLFQHVLSFTTHALLYVLLFLIPFSGWAALSVYGAAPIWLFDLKNVVPPILPVQPLNSRFGYGFFGHIHVYAIYVGGALLSIHLLASLWHHFAVRDNVLVRMWPLGRLQDQAPPTV